MRLGVLSVERETAASRGPASFFQAVPIQNESASLAANTAT